MPRASSSFDTPSRPTLVELVERDERVAVLLDWNRSLLEQRRQHLR